MGKVILLSRVSSQQQDLTQQTEKVLEEIKIITDMVYEEDKKEIKRYVVYYYLD